MGEAEVDGANIGEVSRAGGLHKECGHYFKVGGKLSSSVPWGKGLIVMSSATFSISPSATPITYVRVVDISTGHRCLAHFFVSLFSLHSSFWTVSMAMSSSSLILFLWLCLQVH